MENNDFGTSGFWIFALLILLGLGNGGLGFGGNANAARTATVEDLTNQTNSQRIESMIQSNGNLTEMKFDGLTKGLCDGFYSTNMAIAGVDRSVLESRYLNEKAIADSNASLSAQINALSSKIDQNKIESLQAQVSELKTQNMFCGIPRINPYGYGVYPYANQCGCNCGNI